MIYLELLLAFLKIGCFSFGGAYAAIPLIRDVVLEHGWLTEEALSYFIAVSESTPGPIMVNLATYVGCKTAGVLGGALATFGTIFPAFAIILLVTRIMKRFIENPYVKAVIDGITPAVVGLILATGIFMSAEALEIMGGEKMLSLPDWRGVVIGAILLAILCIYKKLKKKSFSPILLIGISAVLGIVFYSI